MKWIFNKNFIIQNPTLFYGYVISIVLMIIIAIIFVVKEIKKQNDFK